MGTDVRTLSECSLFGRDLLTMIFVTLGSQKFQFDRLLQEIDKCIQNNLIKEDVYAQIGFSTYLPKNFQYKKFIDQEEFNKNIECSRCIITHGGTGAIMSSLKRDKKVIAVPRLKRFDEHVDDHQMQIVKQFEDMNMVASCYDTGELGNIINKIDKVDFQKYRSNSSAVIEDIRNFILK